jgi:hypothetical protein
VAVGLPTVLFGLHALAYGRWIVDDAGITYAYARSLTTGAGPVLQPGADAVEGYSNPAWLALLAVARGLGLFDRGAWFGVPDYVAFPKLLALLLVAGTFGCCGAIAGALCRRPKLVTALAGSATAAVPSFVIWTVSGLENALLALVATGTAALLVRAELAGRLLASSTAVGSGLLAAMAALTRPDGLSTLRLSAGRPDASAARRAAPRGHRVRGQRGRVRRAGRCISALASRHVRAVPAQHRGGKAQGLPGAAALLRPGEIVGYVGWLTACSPPPSSSSRWPNRGRAGAASSPCSSRPSWRLPRSGCSKATGWGSSGSPLRSGRSPRRPR